MKVENGEKINFFDWVRDVRVLVGALVGSIGALTVAVLYMGEVLAAPEVAEQAQIDTRVAQTTANEAKTLATENRQMIESQRRTWRIVFCTSSAFDLSETGRAQLECWRVEGGD